MSRMIHEKVGYLKLYRNLGERAIWENANVLKVWLWALIKAHWKESDKQIVFSGKKRSVGVGEFITGRKRGSAECDMPESTFYRSLKKLENHGAIVLKSDKQKTLVTVVNWAKYQGNGVGGEQQTNNKRATREQRVDTDEEVKNIRKEEQQHMVEEKSSEELKDEKQGIEFHLLTYWGNDGRMGWGILTKFVDLQRIHGADKLRAAIEIAAEQNKKSLAYVRGILEPKNKMNKEVEKFLRGEK